MGIFLFCIQYPKTKPYYDKLKRLTTSCNCLFIITKITLALLIGQNNGNSTETKTITELNDNT